MSYRPEFWRALGLLARASGIVAARGLPPPVPVGGAVVEFDTMSGIASGDFDLVTAEDEAGAEALLAVGFGREDRRGRLQRGFYHPDLPIGVEFVSGGHFDGAADRSRVRVLALPEGEVMAAPTADMIADRLGQWVASDRLDAEMLDQARALVLLAANLDDGYLARRVRHETAGRLTLEEFRALADPHHP